jgi:dipeptidyl aminopeptidase/acylaminoacyl peptidase
MTLAVRDCVRTVLALILFVLASSGGASPAHADRLVDARLVVRGEYLAPRVSPDGRELLLTGPQLRGLYVVASSGGGAVRPLVDDAEAGVVARWNNDGSVTYRAPRAGARRDLVVDRTGSVRTVATATAPLAFASDDRMYVSRGGKTIEIGTGDRFFGALVAPDGDHVVFQGLATGLYVYTRSTGALVRVGPGTAPAWSPDSKRLVFEVTEDDGHDILASDLYLYDVAGDRVSQLTTTDRVIERHPSFGPGGTSIAYDDNDGGVFVAKVVP